MVFIVFPNKTVKTVAENINVGDTATQIVVVSPFSGIQTVSLRYKLPTGAEAEPAFATYAEGYPMGDGYDGHVYVMNIPPPMTEQPGTVQIAIVFTDTSAQQFVSDTVTIEVGGVESLPFPDNEEQGADFGAVLEALLAEARAFINDYNNGAYDVESAQEAARQAVEASEEAKQSAESASEAASGIGTAVYEAKQAATEAKQAAQGVDQYASAAENAASRAEQAETDAYTARTQAEGYASASRASAAAASTAASSAQSSAESAESSSAAASSAQSASSASASAAQSAATAAQAAATEAQNAVDEFLDTKFPVGLVFMFNNSINPAQVYGGTWEQVCYDRAPIGAGDTYTVGETTGAETHRHSANGTMFTALSYSTSNGGIMYQERKLTNEEYIAFPDALNRTSRVNIANAYSSVSLQSNYVNPVYGYTTYESNYMPSMAFNFWARIA